MNVQKIENKTIFLFLGNVFMLMGLMLFAYCYMDGLMPIILNIHIMTNPIFYLILGMGCYLSILFENACDKLNGGEEKDA